MALNDTFIRYLSTRYKCSRLTFFFCCSYSCRSCAWMLMRFWCSPFTRLFRFTRVWICGLLPLLNVLLFQCRESARERERSCHFRRWVFMRNPCLQAWVTNNFTVLPYVTWMAKLTLSIRYIACAIIWQLYVHTFLISTRFVATNITKEKHIQLFITSLELCHYWLSLCDGSANLLVFLLAFYSHVLDAIVVLVLLTFSSNLWDKWGFLRVMAYTTLCGSIWGIAITVSEVGQ